MAEEILPLIDFSKVKKKRRQEEPDIEDQDDQGLDDFLKVKKTKGKKKKPKKDKNENDNPDIENEDPNNTNGAYSYDFLLKRIYNTINAQSGNSKSNAEIKIPNITLGIGKSNKTNWSNFGKICEILRRDKEHFKDYVAIVLNVEVSLGMKDELYLKGKQKITEAMLKKVVERYSEDYIKCPNCKSYKTILRKEQRLLQIYCEVCKGAKTVQNITSRGGGGGKKK